MDLFPILEMFYFIPTIRRTIDGWKNLVNFMKDIIKEKAAQDPTQHHDIISQMVHASGTEGKLTLEELVANAVTFFVAGHETTAQTLNWAVYELSQHQDIQEKLFQEIQNKIGDKNPDFDDINLEYLECFLMENLRLHTPLSLFPTREATTDLDYNGLIIPKGSLLSINFYTIHRNPEIWPDPEKFDPDRFLPDQRKDRHKFAHVPFSAGPRQCIGMNISMIEQRLFIIRLLQKFKVLPSKVHPCLTLKPKVIMNRVPLVHVHLQPRSPLF